MPHKRVSELSAMSAMFSGMTCFEFGRERDAARRFLDALYCDDVGATGTACGRECSNTRWFGRKGSVVRGTSVVVHMRVTAGVASIDSPRPQTFLVIDAGLNSVVFAGGQ